MIDFLQPDIQSLSFPGYLPMHSKSIWLVFRIPDRIQNNRRTNPLRKKTCPESAAGQHFARHVFTEP
jgi:hypothetical protein